MKRAIILIILSMFLVSCGFFESDEGISAAVRAGDPEMCAALDESESQGRIDRCYDRVAQKIKKPEVCKRIGSNDRKDDCYSGIAVKTRDGELCEKIGGYDERNDCYSGVSEKTGDVKLCDKIDTVYSSEIVDCYSNAALSKRDSTLCMKLKTTNDRNDCLSKVAGSSRDMEDCSQISDRTQKIACETKIAVNSGDDEKCKEISSAAARAACKDQINNKGTQESCESEYDCLPDEICKEKKCIKPKCTEDTKYCAGDKLNICVRGKLETSTCIYGCGEKDCKTKAEADEEKKEETEENECDEGYITCLSDTTLEYCKDGVKKKGFCKYGCKKNTCSEEPKVDLSGTIADMKDKQQFGEIVSGPYMDALNKAIDKEKDPSKRAGLEAYSEFLGKSADTYGDAVTKLEDLEKIKRIFIDQYDPSMDIENMKVREMFDQGLGGKLADAISGLWPFGGKPSVEQQEQAQAEEQLKVYEAMLERQKEIEFLKKSRVDRIGTTMADMMKDKIYSEVTDKAKELAEKAGGTAFMTVGIVGDALQTVQDEAQNMMFTGLIKAYNRRRVVLEEQNPSMSNEDIHKLTVSQVEDFPYTDAKTGVIIAKYGNLLANKDCTEEGNNNPLCVDRHTFWVSMDKSYAHFNDKKMYDRWLAQMKAE